MLSSSFMLKHLSPYLSFIPPPLLSTCSPRLTRNKFFWLQWSWNGKQEKSFEPERCCWKHVRNSSGLKRSGNGPFSLNVNVCTNCGVVKIWRTKNQWKNANAKRTIIIMTIIQSKKRKKNSLRWWNKPSRISQTLQSYDLLPDSSTKRRLPFFYDRCWERRTRPLTL